MDELTQLQIKTKNNQAVVSSRIIAEKFAKEHKNIIAKIDKIIKNWNKDTRLKIKHGEYFISSSYKDSSGKNNREYLLSRDGFSYVVMGFTGREADVWKVKYIEAFNKMETFIREKLSSEWKEMRIKTG